jgi:hypothetical protein
MIKKYTFSKNFVSCQTYSNEPNGQIFAQSCFTPNCNIRQLPYQRQCLNVLNIYIHDNPSVGNSAASKSSTPHWEKWRITIKPEKKLRKLFFQCYKFYLKFFRYQIFIIKTRFNQCMQCQVNQTS